MPGVLTVSDGSFTQNGEDNMSIQNGIQHPAIFYTWGRSWYSLPPVGYSYYNLWSMDNTTTDFNDNAVVKTIYDPCPVGFHMPASNAFTGFTTTGNSSSNQTEWNVSGDWDMGWNFNNKITSPNATVYFPASGYRQYDSGGLYLVGYDGNFWSAVPTASHNGCSLYFEQWFVFPQGYRERPSGFAVHPVSE